MQILYEKDSKNVENYQRKKTRLKKIVICLIESPLKIMKHASELMS